MGSKERLHVTSIFWTCLLISMCFAGISGICISSLLTSINQEYRGEGSEVISFKSWWLRAGCLTCRVSSRTRERLLRKTRWKTVHLQCKSWENVKCLGATAIPRIKFPVKVADDDREAIHLRKLFARATLYVAFVDRKEASCFEWANYSQTSNHSRVARHTEDT